MIVAQPMRGSAMFAAPTDLAGGIRSRSRLTRVPHHDLVDVFGLQAGALDDGAGSDRAELRRMNVPERSAVLADRRAGSAQDHDVAHGHKQ